MVVQEDRHAGPLRRRHDVPELLTHQLQRGRFLRPRWTAAAGQPQEWYAHLRGHRQPAARTPYLLLDGRLSGRDSEVHLDADAVECQAELRGERDDVVEVVGCG
jgi:hypothetical protein